mmetsp:Transcript_29583/g.69233  ORF Transcript_29583/g.69233 Transcript_29583/m.69233 type:complete len:355 (+) Transcript_29583:714-1778(+)
MTRALAISNGVATAVATTADPADARSCRAPSSSAGAAGPRRSAKTGNERLRYSYVPNDPAPMANPAAAAASRPSQSPPGVTAAAGAATANVTGAAAAAAGTSVLSTAAGACMAVAAAVAAVAAVVGGAVAHLTATVCSAGMAVAVVCSAVVGEMAWPASPCAAPGPGVLFRAAACACVFRKSRGVVAALVTIEQSPPANASRATSTGVRGTSCRTPPDRLVGSASSPLSTTVPPSGVFARVKAFSNIADGKRCCAGTPGLLPTPGLPGSKTGNPSSSGSRQIFLKSPPPSLREPAGGAGGAGCGHVLATGLSGSPPLSARCSFTWPNTQRPPPPRAFTFRVFTCSCATGDRALA